MDESARIVERHARRGCIDRHGHRGPGRRIAGKVGRHRSELVASAQAGCIPARLVRGGRVGCDRREGAATCGPPLEAHGADARAEIGRGRSDMDVRTGDDGTVRRVAHRDCRRGVVDARGAQSARAVEAAEVGGDGAEVVLPVADAARIEVGRERRARVGCDLRPGPCTHRAALEDDLSRIGLGRRIQRDGARQVRARIVKRRRRRVVDDHRANRGGHREAGVVDDDDLELGIALGGAGRVPVDGVRGCRVGRDRDERGRAVGPDEELDRGHSRSRVAGEGRDRDRAVHVRPVRGSGQRAARQLCVDANRRRLEGLDVACVVG